MTRESGSGVLNGTVPLTFEAEINYQDIFGHSHVSSVPKRRICSLVFPLSITSAHAAMLAL
jgi:hypothetical protein